MTLFPIKQPGKTSTIQKYSIGGKEGVQKKNLLKINQLFQHDNDGPGCNQFEPHPKCLLT